MGIKQMVSAFTAICFGAGISLGSAVTANAEEQELSYVNNNTTLSEYQYGSTSNETYTLNDAGKTALDNAKAGDKLTITYTLESTHSTELRWRSGFKIAGKQLYINGYTETNRGNWEDKNNYHINTDLVTNQTAEVAYTITLNEGGSASNLSVTVTCGGTPVTGEIPLSNADITSLTLNTADRNNSKPDHAMELTNFKASLTTVNMESEILSAEKYTGYTNDADLANPDALGFTATIDSLSDKAVSSLTWYLKNGNSEYKELTSGKIPTVSGNGSAMISLIVYDLPEDVTAGDISAGYTYNTATAIE